MQSLTVTDYQAAEREVSVREARTGFRVHATVYAIVIPILATVNLLVVPQFLWFEFPMLGWGLGLGLHYALGYRRAAEQVARHQAQVTLAAAGA
jgi:uncharacterized membrane protein YdbT with pleckstrin-like domain